VLQTGEEIYGDEEYIDCQNESDEDERLSFHRHVICCLAELNSAARTASIA
jgi:hypothetical protein